MTRLALIASLVLAFPASAEPRGAATMSSHELPALDCSESEMFVERKDGERQTVVRCWTGDDADTQAWRDASMEGGYRSVAFTFADANAAPLALTGCRITSTLSFGSGDSASVRVGLACADGGA